MGKNPRSLRLAAIGDGLIGPLVYTGRSAAGLERLFIDNRFINWLRLVLPSAELPEDAVFGVPGETTVAVSKRVHAVLELDPLPRAVLICAGTEDGKAALRGVAPTPEEAVNSLESMAAAFIAAGIKPIFIVPPPCALFSNGLFADRFIAICATLRRLSGEDRQIGLIDATDVLIKPRSFGIEPDPRYVAASADGRLSSLGAFRLAQVVAGQLRSMFRQNVVRRPSMDSVDALNKNPSLTGSRGTIRGGVSGHCANDYSIDAHQTGGAIISATTRSWRHRGIAQRLTFSGCYTTTWGFVRLCQDIAKEAFDCLSAGDEIEAVCDFELAAPTANIASVSLHAAPVWDKDFIGLHSRKYVGGVGVSEAHAGRLRIPVFTLPSKLKKLHISVQVHLVPGTNLDVSGQLDIHSIVLRKIKRRKYDTGAVGRRDHEAVVQGGRQV